MKKGGNPKQKKEERGMMMGEDFDAPKIPRKKKISIAKKKISLPSIQSESLYSFKKDALSKILEAQKVKGVSKMKKNDMIKKNLEIKGLEEGVKWEDKAWLLQDLKDAKKCNDPTDATSGLQSLQYQLKKQMKKIEKIRSLKTSNTEEARDKRRSMGLTKDRKNSTKNK